MGRYKEYVGVVHAKKAVLAGNYVLSSFNKPNKSITEKRSCAI